MYVFNIDDFPYLEFGNDLKRKVRLIMSPFTSEKGDMTIVHVELPPKGISEGHVHDDCDEIIHFDHDGKVIIDGNEYLVKKNSVVFAQKGKTHECINISEKDHLNLLCIFVPPFKPYGLYPELIEKTKFYLDKQE